MPAPYLDVAGFTALTVMPDTHVAEVEANYPGWLLNALSNRSRWLDSRLRKRYAAPFVSPYPETVTGWLCDIVTLRATLKRGVDPDDKQFAEIKERHDKAELEVTEAANSETGLFDLPLAVGGGTDTATGIVRGGPLSYSEQSPYVFKDQQARGAFSEDLNGRGTSRG